MAGEISETARDRTALKLALRKRQDKAREYFDELAGKFGRSYVPGRSWEALAHVLITLLPPLTVADLGAGEGTLAQLLAKNARKVIAVDNSPKMVEFASALAKKHGFRNIEYRLGDMQSHRLRRTASISRFSVRRCIMRRSRNAQSRAPAPFCERIGALWFLDLFSHSFE